MSDESGDGGRRRPIPDYPRCGAKRRGGPGTCGLAAGWGTNHLGVGRCKLHGGRNPVKHGRYSTLNKHRLRDLIEQHAADPDPLDILPELAAARALFQDYVDRYDEWRDALIAWHASFSDEYRDAVARAEEDGDDPPDPLNYVGKPRQVLDIADAYRIISEITKIVSRIEKIRSENAISRPELFRLMGEMARVVELWVQDERVLEQIKNGWLSIRLA